MKKHGSTVFWALALIAVLLLLLWVMDRRGGTLTGPRGPRIQETQTLVRGIRGMASLVTACYCDEVVLTARKPRTVNAFGANLPLPDDEVCIISHGKAQAGVDLTKLSDDALTLHGDTVMVALPAPELFEVILNPSDYEIFVEEGKWSHEEVVAIERRARDVIRRDALAAGLLEKASESAARQVDRLLRSFGYREVIVVPHALPLPAGERKKE